MTVRVCRERDFIEIHCASDSDVQYELFPLNKKGVQGINFKYGKVLVGELH